MTATIHQFKSGERVAWINAHHRLIRNSIVIREFLDQNSNEVRVELRYEGENGTWYTACPHRCRVGREVESV